MESKSGENSNELSDYDIHCIIESLQTRDAVAVAKCALGIGVLFQEIQKQLLTILLSKSEENFADYGKSASVKEIENQKSSKINRIISTLRTTNTQKQAPDKITLILKKPLNPVASGSRFTLTEQEYGSNRKYSIIRPKYSTQSSGQNTLLTQSNSMDNNEELKPEKTIHCFACNMFLLDKDLANHACFSHAETTLETHGKSASSNTTNGIHIKTPKTAQDSIDISEILTDYYTDKGPNLTETAHRRNNVAVRIPCPTCGLVVRKQHLKRHMLTHTGEKLYACDQCSKSFGRKDKFVDHMRKKHDPNFTFSSNQPRKGEGKQTYSCEYCDMENCFSTRNSLRLHVRSAHSEKHFKCDKCDHFFSSKHWLKQHEAIHRETHNIVCDQCGKYFKSSRTLKFHQDFVHLEMRPHKCELCEKAFATHGKLLAHQATHLGKKPFVCEICGKTFTHLKNVQRHVLEHNSSKAFKCDICERAFTRAENMRAHRKLHDAPHAKKVRVERINAATAAVTTADLSETVHIAADQISQESSKEVPADLCSDAIDTLVQ